ncbi:MAG: hypothetical protein HOC91_00550 [Nitrospinaceae bacterium]|nr:hypothetical protein [Nitrospinaceae bacterium]MBT3434054.1 hypothetical protein [Nitrospinaceae bacterium]MBT3820281.1 hypothetical protein [Nitrospinaceae bacterium]MBT4092373.1 hypothetical protein [Nitrospinaceae bacterium]MBT4428982.1 hypothetical protein [Nitrospinaceae bacterium]
MRNWIRAGSLGAALLLLASLWGCTTSYVQRPVTLRYEGPKSGTLIDPSVQAFPNIIIVPFVDLRRKKSSFGTYHWGGLSVDFISGRETVATGVTRLVRDFLLKAGMKPVNGKWNGRLDSLPGIQGEHAIYGEIERLDFSGKGRFYEAKNKGTIRLIIKWGNRSSRKIVTRKVEITPNTREIHLFTSDFNHVERMEGLIRSSVNRAIREGLTTLFNSPTDRGR